jgi:selenide,water dikinase
MTATTVSLTSYSPGGGCACKMPQRLLDGVLRTLRLDGLDDAAVLDLPGLDDRSLVVTCDFGTPIVDDPYAWGRIAATNALSDVYAMGGRPLLALNLLAWPEELGRAALADVLAGGARTVTDAGAVIGGGHSIADPTPTYGLAVVGEVRREAVLRNSGGRAGDLLVLTKPLGTGVIGTAVKRGQSDDADVRTAIEVMTRSNAGACAVAVRAGLRGCTDVTGFGLLGHAHALALASGVAARIRARDVPVLPGVLDLLTHGAAPDGARRTLADADWFDPGDLDEYRQLLLADPQTSGGLLLCVPPDLVWSVVAALHDRGEIAAVVGDLIDGRPGQVSA